MRHISVRDAWLEYRAKVIPRDAGPNQVRETRIAFYAGAATMFATMTALSEKLPEDEAIVVLDRINSELVRFGEMIVAGGA